MSQTTTQRRQKDSPIKVALYGLLGVTIGFAAITIISARVMELARGSEPDLAIQTLQQSVEADLENDRGVTLQSDVACGRTSEYGIWTCTFRTRDQQSTLRVRWNEDGSFSYVGGWINK